MVRTCQIYCGSGVVYCGFGDGLFLLSVHARELVHNLHVR